MSAETKPKQVHCANCELTIVRQRLGIDRKPLIDLPPLDYHDKSLAKDAEFLPYTVDKDGNTKPSRYKVKIKLTAEEAKFYGKEQFEDEVPVSCPDCGSATLEDGDDYLKRLKKEGEERAEEAFNNQEEEE